MGLGKKFKRFVGSVGTATGELTGSKAIGRGTAMLAGAALGIPGSIGGNAGYSNIGKEITGTKNAIAQAQMQAQQTQTLNEQIAEQTRLKLLAEADLQQQAEEQKKRTTFAGATMQGINERKKLLGV